MVNGRPVDIPSHLTKENDRISVHEGSKKLAAIRTAVDKAQSRGIPGWVQLDADKLEGTLMSVIASLVGGLAGTALSFYLVDHPVVMAQSSEAISFSGATMSTALRTLPTWDTLVLPVILMMVLGGLISFFPAWKLGRLRPVDALREV